MYKQTKLIHFFVHLLNPSYGLVQEKEIQIQPVSETDRSYYIRIMTNQKVAENHTGRYKDKEAQIKHNINYWNNKKKATQPCYKMHKILYENKVVGFMEIYDDHTDPEVAYVAYSIDPAYWKNGICTLSLRKLLVMFKPELKKLGIKHIRATVRISNKGSLRVLEKNGFKVIGEKFFADLPIHLLELVI